jgi:1,4-alpha-glucan branching enzyme
MDHVQGYLALVLHSHLPFVRHPEHDQFLEEDWLYEAITETYIPLLRMFDRLSQDGIDFRLTMSLSPTLIAMLTDPLLQNRYLRHITRLIDLARNEVSRTRNEPAFHALALMYLEQFTASRRLFEETYGRNLVTAFRSFQDQGSIEIITSAATHAFLPLLQNPKAVRAQILVAVQEHVRHLGSRPRGIWLPECGYYEGLDEILKEAGIDFFFTDAHGLYHASPRPKYGTYAPVACPSGVAAFGRDLDSSKQVWSSVEGYPGDFDYREFYRDVGFDLKYDYIRPFLHDDGARVNVGIKYYRITGTTDRKEPYDRHRALVKAGQHAGDFLYNRELQVQRVSGMFGDRTPIIVAPYDAELFGHWWFEGPDWLNLLIRKISRSTALRLTTPGRYLEKQPPLQTSRPSAGSWGQEGFSAVWLDSSNDWIYRHLHTAADRMEQLAATYPAASGLLKRALTQAARELLLAQSSDWAFMLRTGSHAEYATRRSREHILRFTRLYDDIRANRIDEAWLQDIEYRDNLFPDLEYGVYA